MPRLGIGLRRGPPCRYLAANDMTFTTFAACGLVFQAAFESTRFGLAPQPLAFAVSDPAHGRAAVVAAIRGRGARGIPERLVAARTVAENLRNFSAA